MDLGGGSRMSRLSGRVEAGEAWGASCGGLRRRKDE